jgi:hypothetical protein
MPEVQEAHERNAALGNAAARVLGDTRFSTRGFVATPRRAMVFTSMNEKTSRGQSDERGLKAQALPAASTSRSV